MSGERERDRRRGKQTIWLKERETELGLRLGEEGEDIYTTVQKFGVT